MTSLKNTLQNVVPLVAVFLGLLFTGLPASAQSAIQGSCSGYFDLPEASGTLLSDGTIARPDPIPVLRDNVEVLDRPSDGANVVATLPFQERVFITKFENGFYAVNRDSRVDNMPDLGWVSEQDLLCTNLPLVNEDGISRKFIVRTQATYAGEGIGGLAAKAGPETDACVEVSGGSCRELTRFNIFYVYAIDEENQRVLLLGSPISRGAESLIGWVNFEDGYFWDTRFGMRPRENLVFQDGTNTLDAGSERRACLYQTLEEAEAADDSICYVPILGGNRWFKYSLRIPIFDRVEHAGQNYFRVALPSAGVGEDASEDVLTQVQGLDSAISALQNLTNLDVFFLLDGTQSMQPNIDSIIGTDGKKGVLEAIQAAFANDPRFESVRIRYGYRVYRDHYAGDFGIGEGLPFDNNCNPTAEELEINHQRFQTEIRNIDTQKGANSGVRDSDHEENLILGLAFAADDMVTCTQNTKLLFVVGDTGYDLQVQQERGTPIGSEEEVLGYLTQSFSTDVDPIIPFFIQAPRVSERENYEAAYTKFKSQARFFTERIGQHFLSNLKGASEANISEHFFSLDGKDPETAQTELIEFVLDRVSGFGDQRPVNEIIAELQGGAALVDIISALQSDDAASVPALRLAQIEKRICEELGSACTERVFNDVTEGYIADDEDAVLDVWIFGDEFRNWQLKLDIMAQSNQLTAKELSTQIVRMMVDGLKNVTGDELSPGDLNMSMADFLKRKHGLPTGSQSPLLNYTIGDFVYAHDDTNQGEDLVEVCELYRVARWLESHREVFAAVDDTEVPLFNLEESTGCDMRRPTPELVYGGRERFPDRAMSFRHEQMDAGFFWVPNAYLP